MERRLPELDGLRAISIVLVAYAHYLGRATFWGQEWLKLPTRLGWAGVDVFFALSGFLVTASLLRYRGTAGFFSFFFLRRALRILPLYYVTLGLIAVALTTFRLSYTLPNWMPYFVQLQPFYFAWRGVWPKPYLAVTWSLGVEEFFYLLAPFAVARVSPRNLVRCCCIGLVAFPCVRMVLSGVGIQYQLASTILRPDSLLAGSLVAFWRHRYGARLPLPGRAMGLLWGLLFGLFLWIHFGGIALSLRQLVGGGYGLLAALNGCTLLLLLSDLRLSTIRRVLSFPPIAYLGRISYGVYLLHMLVYFVVTRITGSYSVLTCLKCGVITCAIAALSWEYFERPLVEWSRRITEARSSRPPSGSPGQRLWLRGGAKS